MFNRFNIKKYTKNKQKNKETVNISINIDNVDYFYDPLDANKATISNDILDYIASKVETTSYKQKVSITFNSPKMLDKEKEKIKDAMKAYYGMMLFQNYKKYGFDKLKVLILLICGTSLLAITYVLSSKYKLVIDILSIAGWVSIWEMVSTIIFGTADSEREKHSYLKLYNAKIIFRENIK